MRSASAREAVAKWRLANVELHEKWDLAPGQLLIDKSTYSPCHFRIDRIADNGDLVGIRIKVHEFQDKKQLVTIRKGRKGGEYFCRYFHDMYDVLNQLGNLAANGSLLISVLNQMGTLKARQVKVFIYDDVGLHDISNSRVLARVVDEQRSRGLTTEYTGDLIELSFAQLSYWKGPLCIWNRAEQAILGKETIEIPMWYRVEGRLEDAAIRQIAIDDSDALNIYI